LLHSLRRSSIFTSSLLYSSSLFFFLILRLPPRSTLFPYTTLFRSLHVRRAHVHPQKVRLYLRSEPWHALVSTYFPSFTTKQLRRDRKSTRLNSSHVKISYAVFCLKKKKKNNTSKTQKEQ